MKYLFNWTGGAGGDFLLCILTILEPERAFAKNQTPTVCNTYTNRWGIANPINRPFHNVSLDGGIQLSHDMKDDMILQFHDLYILYRESTVLISEFASNVRKVNLTSNGDVAVDGYIHYLLSIKSFELTEYSLGTAYPGCINIDYNELIIKQDMNAIETFLLAFDIDVTLVDLCHIQRIIKKYHLCNRQLLPSFTRMPKDLASADSPRAEVMVLTLGEMELALDMMYEYFDGLTIY